jgi:hypothetical protein
VCVGDQFNMVLSLTLDLDGSTKVGYYTQVTHLYYVFTCSIGFVISQIFLLLNIIFKNCIYYICFKIHYYEK